MCKYCSVIFVFIIIIVQLIGSAVAYDFAIQIEGALCTDQMCGQEKHTLCGSYTPSTNCRDFKVMSVSSATKNAIVMGHNGIRNKIAGNWYLANVNLLHWSKELGDMASLYLYHCRIAKDKCDYIVDRKMTIGQNFLFVNSPPTGRWHGQVIRKWFLEMGPDIKSLRDYKNSNRPLNNFTQMIWPNSEFVGCAAARMFDGFMVVCYYYPAAKFGDYSIFLSGKPCDKCPESRPTCSRDFKTLCGIDYDATRSASQPIIINQHFYRNILLLITGWFFNFLIK